MQPFLTVRQIIRLHAGRAQQYGNPLIFRECLAALLYFIHVDIRHLDRGQLADTHGVPLFIFLDKLILKLDDAPDSAAEQAVIF